MMIKHNQKTIRWEEVGGADLVPPPEGVPHDVDDGTETADPLVVAVHPVSPVVVVLGANLDRRGGSNVTNYVIAD